MGGGKHCGGGARRIIYRGICQGRENLSSSRDAYSAGRSTEHARCRSNALRTVHVLLRDRFALAAGGDHRGGGDGEEEDLKTAPSYELRLKLAARSSRLVALWN